MITRTFETFEVKVSQLPLDLQKEIILIWDRIAFLMNRTNKQTKIRAEFHLGKLNIASYCVGIFFFFCSVVRVFHFYLSAMLIFITATLVLWMRNIRLNCEYRLESVDILYPKWNSIALVTSCYISLFFVFQFVSVHFSSKLEPSGNLKCQ